MYRNKRVAVVVPAHNEELLIGRVLDTMPDFVDTVVVVNDTSTDRTAEIVRERARRAPGRVVLIDLPVNQGVGGAIAEGYKWARDRRVDLTAVMAGDAQMDPADLPALLDPLVEGRADYTKGNRLRFGDAWSTIPKVRYLGNSALSLMTKVASGYWHVADSQTGYTVASLEVLRTLDLDAIYKRYGMPNDVLVKLNVHDFRVRDVYVKPVYNIGEKSGMHIWKLVFTLPVLLFRLFTYRLHQKYIVRDFHPLVLFYATGALLLLIEIPFAIRFMIAWIEAGTAPDIALSSLLASSLGMLCVVFAMFFDRQANRDLRGV